MTCQDQFLKYGINERGKREFWGSENFVLGI